MRGPIKASDDLKVLPLTLPPLLGRHALKMASSDLNWTLEWGLKKYVVSVISKHHLSDGEFECIQVTENNPIKSRYFQFVNLKYTPDSTAQAAYLIHTKRQWASPGRLEETAFFFEVDEFGSVLPSNNCETGKIHAILPTKLALPTQLSWQASWLLSIDRQEVQSIFDNDWNKSIMQKAVPLLLTLLRWIASGQQKSLYNVYSLLPPITKDSGTGSLFTTLLDLKLNVSSLISCLKQEPLVPSLIPHNQVIASSTVRSFDYITYQKSSLVLWLPAAFLKNIPPILLSSWFGMKIFPSCFLKELASSDLWMSSVTQPSSSLLQSRKRFFNFDSSDIQDKAARTNIATALVGAIGECLTTDTKNKLLNLTPVLEEWPVFLTCDGTSFVTLVGIPWGNQI